MWWEVEHRCTFKELRAKMHWSRTVEPHWFGIELQASALPTIVCCRDRVVLFFVLSSSPAASDLATGAAYPPVCQASLSDCQCAFEPDARCSRWGSGRGCWRATVSCTLQPDSDGAGLSGGGEDDRAACGTRVANAESERLCNR